MHKSFYIYFNAYAKAKVNKKILFAGIFIFVLFYGFAQNNVRDIFQRYAVEYADKTKKEIPLAESGRDGVLFCFSDKNSENLGHYYKLRFFGSMGQVEYVVIDEGTVRYIHETQYTYRERYSPKNAQITEVYYEINGDRVVSFDLQGRMIKNEPEIKEKLQAILKTIKDNTSNMFHK